MPWKPVVWEVCKARSQICWEPGKNWGAMETLEQKRQRARLSRRLSWITRHGAEEMRLEMTPAGWIKVQQVLQIGVFKHVTLEMLQETAALCEKQRFEVKLVDNEWCVCESRTRPLA